MTKGTKMMKKLSGKAVVGSSAAALLLLSEVEAAGETLPQTTCCDENEEVGAEGGICGPVYDAGGPFLEGTSRCAGWNGGAPTGEVVADAACTYLLNNIQDETAETCKQKCTDMPACNYHYFWHIDEVHQGRCLLFDKCPTVSIYGTEPTTHVGGYTKRVCRADESGNAPTPCDCDANVDCTTGGESCQPQTRMCEVAGATGSFCASTSDCTAGDDTCESAGETAVCTAAAPAPTAPTTPAQNGGSSSGVRTMIARGAVVSSVASLLMSVFL